MRKISSEENMKKNTNAGARAQEEVKELKFQGLKRIAHNLRLQIETVQRANVGTQQEYKKT